MASEKRRFPRALMITVGVYLTAVLIVLTRPGATLSGDERTVIRFAHWQIQAGPREALDTLIKRYEQINPHVRVEQVAVPIGIYAQWLRTQLIGGSAPDIVEFGRLFDADDIPPRFFEPLSNYMELPNPYNHGTALESVRWRDTFLDGLNTADTYIENLNNYYAVTLTVVSQRLFYNPKLLQDITDSRIAPSTYTDINLIGEKLANFHSSTQGHISLYAGSDIHGLLLMEQMLSRAGIGLNIRNDRLREQGAQAHDLAVEYLRGGWDYRSPDLHAGLELMRQVARNMRPGFQQMDRNAAMQEFLSGQAVMNVTGSWDVTTLTSMAPFEIEIVKFPWPSKADQAIGQYYWGPVSEGAGNTTVPLYLNKESLHHKEAVDFLHFITSIEGNTIFMNQSGWLPSIREVKVPEKVKLFLPQTEGLPIRAAYMRGFGRETRDLWNRQLYHLISAHGGVEEFLREFEVQFSAALKRDLNMQTRHTFRSLQHEMPSLTALASLDRLQAPAPHRIASRQARNSSQNIAESRLYEALAALKGNLVFGEHPGN